MWIKCKVKWLVENIVSSFELFDNLLKAVKAVNKKVGEAILIIIEGHETAFNGF